MVELVYRKIGDYNHRGKYVLCEKWLVRFDNMVYYYDTLKEAEKHLNLLNQLEDKKKLKLKSFSTLEAI